MFSNIFAVKAEGLWNYDYSGTIKTFTIPHTGIYQLESIGAQGQNNGGLGGKSQATYTFNKGDVLYIRVGGQDGYNGGGSGLYKGGGATDIRLNGDTLNSRLLVGAGGGAGGVSSAGTNGGNGNGAGGRSVGAGAGSDGINGAGGGASYTYTWETGYYQDYGHYEDLGYYDSYGHSEAYGHYEPYGHNEPTGYYETYSYCESADKQYYHEGIWKTETGCSDANNYHTAQRWVSTGTTWVVDGYNWVVDGYDWVVDGYYWVKTGSKYVIDGYDWIHTGYDSSVGLPGNGGSNYIAYGSNQIKENGVKTGNGYATITLLNILPIITVNTPIENQLVLPKQSFKISGTVRDDDNKGTVKLSYQIDDRAEVEIGTVEGKDVPQNFNADVYVDADEKVGKHNLKIISVDSDGGISEKTIPFEVKDIYNPVLKLTTNNNSSTNQSVIITAKATDNHKVKHIQLPNGNYVNSENVTYIAEVNGTYTFTAEDMYGNIDVKSVTINNIDKGLPNLPTVTVDENWTPENRTISIRDNGDNGFAGVDHIEYRLSGANSTDWKVYNSELLITDEGITNIEAKVIDKVGNESSIVKKTVRIDKQNPNLMVTSNIQGLINTDIILTATANDTLSGVKRMQLPDGNWTSSTSINYTVGENGSYVFKAEDNVGNMITFTKEVKNIKKNVLITHIQQVDLVLTAEDLFSGVTHMRFRNEQGTWSSWEAYKTEKEWTLSTGDGLKHVWVQYKDKVGNVSEAIEDIIILDTVKPTVKNLQINDNDVYTNNRTVKLTLEASDNYTGLESLFISNDNKNWTEIPYTSETTWELSVGDGTKTVYVKVSDKAGNISKVISDTIILDTIKPTASILINDGDSYTPVRDVRLKLTYADGGSGVNKVKIIEGEREYTLPSPTPNSPVTIPWTLDFGVVRTVSILVTDKAGNVSELMSDSITVDKLTIKDFTLEDVVNPLEFNRKHPFQEKVWAFEPQPMISGGNITFAIDVKSAYDRTLVEDSLNYKVEVVGDGGYHKAFVGTMSKSIDHYTQTITIPKDAPNGAKVYFTGTATRVLKVSPYDTQTVYFPGDTDASQRAFIGVVDGNIYDVIRFNEIK